MNREQEHLYQLLEEVDDICRRNNITYYVGGGCALGAIRGGGFMPWDDDIDLHITRDEWKKLIEVMKTELPENRMFVCSDTDPEYGNPIGRYVDRNTTVMMRSQLLSAKACGEMVEFFIFDRMPEDPVKKERHRMLVKTYCELLTPSFLSNHKILYVNKGFSYKHYLECRKRAETEGREKVLHELMDEISSVPDEESDEWYMCWAFVDHEYKKEMFGTPRYVKFERGMFPVAEMQEHVDRIAYGDSWMYVPAVDDQIVHDNHDNDVEIPYQEVVDVYMPLIDKEAVRKAQTIKKNAMVDALYSKSMYKRAFSMAQLEVLGWDLLHKCDSSAADLRELLDKGEYDKVYSGIRDFLVIQGKKRVKQNGIMLPVSDDFLAVVIDYLVRTGKYYAAGGLIRIRREQGEPYCGALADALKEYDHSRELSVAVYDDRDPEKVMEIISGCPEYEDRLDTIRARLWTDARKAETEDDFRKLLEDAGQAVSAFPDDGELIRFAAFALYSLGRKEEAYEKYLEAVKKTRNGFVWKEAGELCGIDAYTLNDSEEDPEEELEDEEDTESADDDQDDDQAPVSDTSAFRMETLKSMLFEIDDICRENDLKYSLTGKFIKELMTGEKLPDDYDYVCIAMTQGDIERLMHIVNDEGDGSRVVETILNNPHAKDMTVRYVNCETTLLNADEFGDHKYYGIYIDIRPIKSYIPGKSPGFGFKASKKVWKSCKRDYDKVPDRSAVKTFALDVIRKIIGEENIVRNYYEADRRAKFVDTWDDIEKAPAIRCGAFRLRRKDYSSVSHFPEFNLKRTWKVEDKTADGHPLMYCSQFYGKHIRGGIHGRKWVLANEIVSPDPYTELMTDEVVEHLDDVRKYHDRYNMIMRPVPECKDVVNSAWNVYLMAKELIQFDYRMDEKACDDIEDAVRSGDTDRFTGLMEEYFEYLVRWRKEETPIVQLPRLRQYIIDAVKSFYPGEAITAAEYDQHGNNKKIRQRTFGHLGKAQQISLLLYAAGTGEWDLKDRKDRREGEVPFVKSDLYSLLSDGRKAAAYMKKNMKAGKADK
ncbi:MAG: LicD family protein [Eubacterium sp.]|nr:LicD family protein [Eubacterium sp.]